MKSSNVNVGGVVAACFVGIIIIVLVAQVGPAVQPPAIAPVGVPHVQSGGLTCADGSVKNEGFAQIDQGVRQTPNGPVAVPVFQRESDMVQLERTRAAALAAEGNFEAARQRLLDVIDVLERTLVNEPMVALMFIVDVREDLALIARSEQGIASVAALAERMETWELVRGANGQPLDSFSAYEVGMRLMSDPIFRTDRAAVTALAKELLALSAVKSNTDFALRVLSRLHARDDRATAEYVLAQMDEGWYKDLELKFTFEELNNATTTRSMALIDADRADEALDLNLRILSDPRITTDQQRLELNFGRLAAAEKISLVEMVRAHEAMLSLIDSLILAKTRPVDRAHAATEPAEIWMSLEELRDYEQNAYLSLLAADKAGRPDLAIMAHTRLLSGDLPPAEREQYIQGLAKLQQRASQEKR